MHTWDHVRWQDHAADASLGWTRVEMTKEVDRYGQIFGHAPRVHGAAGWQMNDSAYALETALGYAVASDTRGRTPYQPVDASGHPIGPAQYPTTLPTFDELLGADGWHSGNVHEALLALTATDTSVQVYTLHAELEGQKLMPSFERLLQGWRAQGHQFDTLGALHAARREPLPRCRAAIGSAAGRSGTLAVQGPLVAD